MPSPPYNRYLPGHLVVEYLQYVQLRCPLKPPKRHANLTNQRHPHHRLATTTCMQTTVVFPLLQQQLHQVIQSFTCTAAIFVSCCRCCCSIDLLPNSQSSPHADQIIMHVVILFAGSSNPWRTCEAVALPNLIWLASSKSRIMEARKATWRLSIRPVPA